MENWLPWSAVTATVVVLTAVGTMIWKLAGWKHKLDDLEPIRKNAGHLVVMIEEIHKHLFAKVAISTNSPISLTEYRKTLSDKTNADEIADINIKRSYIKKQRV